MNALRSALDRALDATLAALMALAVGNVCWQVFTRFLLSQPSAATDEAARFLLIWLGLLGAARAVGSRAHVGITALVDRLPGWLHTAVSHTTHLLIALFAAGVLVYGGARLSLLTLELGQNSAALGVPLGYVYLAVPVSGLLMIAYSLFALAAPRGS